MKLLNLRGIKWSGRMDLNHRPPGPEPGALARLRYAPTDTLRRDSLPKLELQISTAMTRGLGVWQPCPPPVFWRSRG